MLEVARSEVCSSPSSVTVGCAHPQADAGLNVELRQWALASEGLANERGGEAQLSHAANLRGQDRASETGEVREGLDTRCLFILALATLGQLERQGMRRDVQYDGTYEELVLLGEAKAAGQAEELLGVEQGDLGVLQGAGWARGDLIIRNERA